MKYQSCRTLDFKDTRGNQITVHNYSDSKDARVIISRKNGTDIEYADYDNPTDALKRYKREVNLLIDAEDLVGFELED